MTQGSTDSDERTGANSMIKWFLLADGAYIGLFGLYVCEQWAWLGWVIRVIGPVLIFLIPFLIDDKSWRIKCALLACVPIVGDVTFTILSDQQDKARAEKTFIRTEARLDEVFSTDPGDTAANIEGAGTGCEAKATFLAFEAGVAEAALAAQEPALAPAIFSQTGNLSARMQFYDTLPDILERGAGGPAANSLALVQKVQTLLRRQSAYPKACRDDPRPQIRL
jgi:hypothetical protein